MASQGEIVIVISAKNEARLILQGFASDLREMGTSIEQVSKRAALVGTAVIAAMSAIAITTAHAAEEIKNMSLRTGVGEKSLQELAYAAKLCGTDIGTVEAAVKNMSRGISDAASGSGAYGDALARIGLNYQQLQSMSPEQQFFAMADGLTQVTDATEKSSLAQELFGSRIGTQLLPMFAEGADGLAGMRKEAEDLGLVLDDEAAAAAEHFYESTVKMWGALTGLKNEVATTIMPILDTFLNKMLIPALTGFKNLIDKIPQPLKDIFAGAILVGGGMLTIFGTVGLAATALKKGWDLVVTGAQVLSDLVGPVVRAGAALWSFATGIVTKVIPALIAKLALLGPWGWAILAASAAIIAGAIVGIKALVSGGGGGGGGMEVPNLEGLEKTDETEGGTEEAPGMQGGGLVMGSRRGTLVRVGENYTNEAVLPLQGLGGSPTTNYWDFKFEKGAFNVRSDEDIELIAEALHRKIMRAERRLSD